MAEGIYDFDRLSTLLIDYVLVKTNAFRDLKNNLYITDDQRIKQNSHQTGSGDLTRAVTSPHQTPTA